MKCTVCPFGHVCLRWKSLNLHMNATDLVCAQDCLNEVLDGSGHRFSLGDGTFCASRACDGFYYLVCREQVILRMTEMEARTLESEFAAARGVLESAQHSSPHVM